MLNCEREICDSVNLMLLKFGCPVEQGIPARLLHEHVLGRYPAFTASDIFGLSEQSEGHSLLSDYLGKRGYTFSWGTVSEKSGPCDPDDDDSLPILRFEFVPIDLLVTFPQSALLEDLFMWLYSNHPMYDPEFGCDESYSHLSVISFASKEGEEEALRRWVASTFIPSIWPDLLAEATNIVEEKIAEAAADSPDGSFAELFVESERYQLCGDPAELSFNSD